MTAISRAFTAVLLWPRWLVLTAAGIVFVLLWGLPTIIMPLATDQTTFALGARTILDGHQLYGDLWDIKPPLIYLLYAIPFALAGEHMEAVRVFDLVNTVVAMLGIFLLTRRFFGERAGVLAAAFYAFTYLTWSGIDGLGEVESFLAAPGAFAFFLYRPQPGHRRAVFAAGVLLGLAFALKSTSVLLLLGLPAAELLLRDRQGWNARDAWQRLALAALGFVVVQVVLAVYLAVAGVLDDFINIQRHYTFPYNAYRWEPSGLSPYPRFLLQVTAEWVRDTSFLVVPAGVALFFALREPRDRAAAAFVALLAVLGVLEIWWQGKMFRYHWLTVFPLLAPLAGYCVDRVLAVFDTRPRVERWAARALLAVGLVVLAAKPLADTYDNYRTLVSYAGGSLERREVEQRYNPFLFRNHQLVDYVEANGGTDDQLYIWGFWPVAHFWLDRPLVTRFVANNGLRATWTPDSWRRELVDDLSAHPPRYFAVARGDNQPWLTGTTETSDQHVQNSFQSLRRFLDERYVQVKDFDLFVLYELKPAGGGQGP